MTPQPTLNATTDNGEEITLRPAEQRDVEAVYPICRDEETKRFNYSSQLAEGFDRATEQMGLRDEAIQRNGCPHRGERRDAWMSAILPGEPA